MIKLNYHSYLNLTGYGQAGKDILSALTGSGEFDIRLEPLSPISRIYTTDKDYQFYNELIRKERDKKSIQIFHCIPDLQRRKFLHEKNVGFATFETYNPPADWMPILNKNNAVIVPSGFNREVFTSAGVTSKIFHIPHCLNTNEYNINIVPSKKFDKFTFLFFGSWKNRKGWKQLVEAWVNEFDISDNVQLMIKTDRTLQAQKDIKEFIKNLPNIKKEIAPILFENTMIKDVELPAFLKSFNCFVLPTLGEGLGLPGLQCMFLGVPIIITNYSGCKEYANEATATLLEPEGFILHKIMDGYRQFQNLKWAFISIQEIRNRMRYVVNNVEACQEKAIFAADIVKNKFDYNMCVNKFKELAKCLNS